MEILIPVFDLQTYFMKLLVDHISYGCKFKLMRMYGMENLEC